MGNLPQYAIEFRIDVVKDIVNQLSLSVFFVGLLDSGATKATEEFSWSAIIYSRKLLERPRLHGRQLKIFIMQELKI